MAVVLVLDALQRSALAVTRSLGQSGVGVVTADCTSSALAGQSRYSQRYFQSPDPASEPLQWLDWLESLCRSESIERVYPVTEISSQLILEAAPDRRYRIPFADLDKVSLLSDKAALLELADETGAPYPATRTFERGADIDCATIADWPVVLKPTRSRRWLGDRWLSSNVHIAEDANALRQLLRDKAYLREYPLLLQEYIPGHGAGVFALYNKGREQAFFAHRRLREKPPSGGVSVLSESAPLDARCLQISRELLSLCEWHGVAMIEFRVADDGTPYLMEVNTRFWGSLQLAIDAGVDFPTRLHQLESGAAPQPLGEGDYRETRLRWLLGDVDNLYLQLKDPALPLSRKLAAILRFLKPWPSARHEINRWHDLAPAWWELKRWLGF